MVFPESIGLAREGLQAFVGDRPTIAIRYPLQEVGQLQYVVIHLLPGSMERAIANAPSKYMEHGLRVNTASIKHTVPTSMLLLAPVN